MKTKYSLTMKDAIKLLQILRAMRKLLAESTIQDVTDEVDALNDLMDAILAGETNGKYITYTLGCMQDIRLNRAVNAYVDFLTASNNTAEIKEVKSLVDNFYCR